MLQAKYVAMQLMKSALVVLIIYYDNHLAQFYLKFINSQNLNNCRKEKNPEEFTSYSNMINAEGKYLNAINIIRGIKNEQYKDLNRTEK